MGAAVTIDTQDTGVFGYEEMGVTIISYVLQAVGEGKECGACALRRYRSVYASCVSGCGGTSL